MSGVDREWAGGQNARFFSAPEGVLSGPRGAMVQEVPNLWKGGGTQAALRAQ